MSTAGETKPNPADKGPGSSTRRRELFPTTQRTLLGRLVASGDRGLAEANRHVMSVYASPLRAYFVKTSFRDSGDPDEVVQGFFADRLARGGFLASWLESGRPLRFWLIVGFKHFLLERYRSERRHRRWRPLPEHGDGGQDRSTADADTHFHREAAVAIVRDALRRAESARVDAGQAEHWLVFRRHHMEGRSYEQVQSELGIDPKRAVVMARTAANKFRAAVRDVVAWPGATDSAIDEEIRSLMEATRP